MAGGWFGAALVGSAVDGFSHMLAPGIGSGCAGVRRVSASGIGARAPSGVVGMMSTIAIDGCESG